MSAPPSRPVPEYGLKPPTADDAVAMLARVQGPERAVVTWREACRGANLPWPLRQAGPREVLRVCEEMARQPGFPGVVGATVAVRARSYLLLSGGTVLGEEGQ